MTYDDDELMNRIAPDLKPFLVTLLDERRRVLTDTGFSYS